MSDRQTHVETHIRPDPESDRWWAATDSPTAAELPERRLGPAERRLGPARARQAGWALRAAQLEAAQLEAATEPLAGIAVGQGFVVRRAQALAVVSDAELRRRLRAGVWSSPRHGWVTPLARGAGGGPGGDSPEICIAATALARSGSLVSHESAAILYGLPVRFRPRRVQLSVDSASHGGGWAGCVLHAAPTPAGRVASWYGVPVHSVERVVVDVARRSGVAAGLVTADAALRESLVTREALHRCLQESARRPGMVGARRAVELADDGAESPLESLARLCLLDGGVRDPLELQAELPTDRGTYRVDLLLRASRVVIEADGQVKYAAPDALWREKQRQDALERAGWRIVRLTWRDVTTRPEQTVARVRAAASRPTVGVF